jgi:hypothetical protein
MMEMPASLMPGLMCLPVVFSGTMHGIDVAFLHVVTLQHCCHCMLLEMHVAMPLLNDQSPDLSLPSLPIPDKCPLGVRYLPQLSRQIYDKSLTNK